MLEVKTNKEIRNIKQEIFKGLGIREIVIFGVAICVVGYMFISMQLPQMLITYIASPILMLATFIAISRPCGMQPERFLLAMIKSVFINNRKIKIDDIRMKEVEKRVIKNHRKAGLRKNKVSS